MNEKRKLYLLTDYYPYGSGESFVEVHLRELTRYYDVTVFPRYVAGAARPLPEGVTLLAVPRTGSIGAKLRAAAGFFLSRHGRREIGAVLRSGESRVSRLIKSLSAYISAELTWRSFVQSGAAADSRGTLYYSFWYTPAALALSFHRGELPGSRVVVRTNGYDLYNERAGGGRQPFKPAADAGVDAVLFSCQYALNYYKTAFGFLPGTRYLYAPLGTEREEAGGISSGNGLRLISCSSVDGVKRVHRIPEALALLDGIPVDWVHIGDGKELESLRQHAAELLDGCPNVTWRLAGALPHEQLLRLYREEPWDCFITTSTSEGGCPVSIQEAMAFGLPVIGTAVGGITEMLVDSENVLLSAEAPARETADAIERLYRMSREERLALGARNRRFWAEHYDASDNVRGLVERLERLWEEN